MAHIRAGAKAEAGAGCEVDEVLQTVQWDCTTECCWFFCEGGLVTAGTQYQVWVGVRRFCKPVGIWDFGRLPIGCPRSVQPFACTPRLVTTLGVPSSGWASHVWETCRLAAKQLDIGISAAWQCCATSLACKVPILTDVAKRLSSAGSSSSHRGRWLCTRCRWRLQALLGCRIYTSSIWVNA